MKKHASMNRIYRLVWSEVAGCWVAVAEIARGRGKRSSRKLVAATLSLSAVVAHAGPSGGQVVGGSGTITQSGGTTTIAQSSPTLSLNWQSFNIAPQETVDYLQPAATSIAINRISGNSASQILGHLNANGQVYLINPNGILFGRGSQVDVGGLVASTLDLEAATSSDTQSHFTGTSPASVVNKGTLVASTGGYVALLASHVSNQGTISARLGTVALGAGTGITLTFSGNNLLHLQVDQSVLETLVHNGGVISADGGQVLMSAGAKDALLHSVVNNTGEIEARTVESHEGTITLLAGENAGTVDVGGTLDASAPHEGNGGSIETSAAHVEVSNDAKVSTAAASGLAGTWLIDPQDFTIAASGGDITGTQLDSNLAAGNVTILSTSGATSGSGNINVDDAVTWSANKLTLNAQNNINFNVSITASGTGSLALKYGQGASAAGNPATYNLNNASQIDLPAGASFSTTLGSNGALQNYTVITTLSSLRVIGQSGDYALGANIDATATSVSPFTPIAPNYLPFSGTFDGLGHTISGLTTADTPSAGTGLFSRSSGVIQNVGLVGGSISVSASSYTGALVGVNYGTIRNSHSTATVSASNNSAIVGGLVGLNYGGTIANSYSSGLVAGGSNSTYVGGLVGQNSGGTISNSYATGNVSGSVNVGGLVGQNGGTISNSYATGNVSGSTNVGGLVGLSQASNSSNSTISNSYATGSVTGTIGSGGLVGANYGSDYGAFTSTVSNSYATGSVTGTSNVGGLVGINSGSYGSGTISNSYSTGAVNNGVTSAHVGGLVGNNSFFNGNISETFTGSITHSYWDTTASKQATSAGGTGLSPSAMQLSANFTSWDFTNTWTIYSGLTDPLLRSGLTPLTVTANNVSAQYTSLAYSGAGEGVTYSVTPGANLLGTVSYGGSSQTAVNVGSSYVISPSGLYSNQQGYLITYVNGTLAITAAPLTVTGTTVAGRPYNGTTSATLTGGTLSGILGSDAAGLTLTQAGSFSSAHAANGVTVIAADSLSGGKSGNYTLTQPTGLTANIAAVSLTETASIGGTTSKTYDGTPAATSASMTGSVSGAIGGDVLTFNGGGLSLSYDSSHVASATTISASGTAGFTIGSSTHGSLSSDYSLTQPTIAPVSGSITAAPLTATASIGGTTIRTYDGTTTASGATVSGNISGAISGDALTFNSTALSLNYNSSHVASATTISASGPSGFTIGSSTDGSLNSDYSLAQPTIASVSGSITAAPLTATASIGGTTSRIYNGTTSANGATVSGIISGAISGDVLTFDSTGLSLNYNSSHVASATTISASGPSGFTIGSSTDGSLSSDYSLIPPSIAPVSGSITAAPLAATASIGGTTTRTYNGTTTASGATVSGSISGAISGDVLTFNSTGLSLNYNSSHVASATTISASGPSGFTIGSSTDGSLSSDYSLTQPSIAPVSGSITAAPLTATASIGGTTTRVYDGTTAATGAVVNGSVSGSISGDVLDFNGTGLSLNYNSSHVASATTISASGAAGITIGSSTDGSLITDYSLTQQPTIASVSGSITAAPLIATASIGGTTTRTYDGTTTASGATASGSISGAISGDVLTFNSTGLSLNYNSSHVASANTISASGAAGFTIGSSTDGSLNSDYSLTQQPTIASVSGSITAAPLLATASIGGTTTRVYDGTTAATGAVVNGSVSGGISGDVLAFNGTGLSLNYNSSHVASANTISASGAAGFTIGSSTDGSLNSDYSLTQPTVASVSGSITAAPLTATASIGGTTTRVYDGTTAATGAVVNGSFSGGISGDALAFNSTGLSLNYNSSHVASANTISASGPSEFTIGSSTDGSLSSDYSLTQPTIASVSGSITPAPLTASASIGGTTTRTYNGTTIASGATVSGSISGGISGDVLTFNSTGLSLNYNSNQVAGANTISASGTGGFAISASTAGSLNSDYHLTQPTIAPVAGDITAAPLTVLGTSVGNKVYDGTTTATLINGTLSSVVGGDTVTLVQSGNFASKNVGTGISVTATDSLGGASADNYTLLEPMSLMGNITPAMLTVSGTSVSNRVYNGTTAATLSNGTLNGVIIGDVVTLSQSGTFASKNVSANARVTATDSLSGAAAGNYVLIEPAGLTGAITSATLTYTADPVTGLAGQTPRLSGTISGFSLGDTLSNSTSGSATWTIVGNDSQPGVYGIDGDGLAASNYYFVQAAANASALTLRPASAPQPVIDVTAQLESPVYSAPEELSIDTRSAFAPTVALSVVNGGIKLPVDVTGGY